METMGGVQIPNAIAGGIFVVGIIGFRLQASVEVNVQTVAAPGVVPVGSDGGGMADAEPLPTRTFVSCWA